MSIIKTITRGVASLGPSFRSAAAASKTIIAKNALIVGDDMAVKTERSLGIRPEREGAALWQSTMGALRNRMIIWPAALGISIIAPAAIPPMLMAGAVYLCYEVAHALPGLFGKNAHHDHHADDATETDDVIGAQKLQTDTGEADAQAAYEAFEKNKINTFVRTDFVMAMETTAIGMGQVMELPLVMRAISLGVAGVALLAGVTTAVFGLLKLDDLGRYLSERKGEGLIGKAQRGVGDFILKTAPGLMKTLSVLGIGAMLLVGGNILSHGIPALAALSHAAAHAAYGVPIAGGILSAFAPLAVSVVTGLATGFAVLAAKPGITAVYDRTLKPMFAGCRALLTSIGNLMPEKKLREPLATPSPESLKSSEKAKPPIEPTAALKPEKSREPPAPLSPQHAAAASGKGVIANDNTTTTPHNEGQMPGQGIILATPAP